MKQIKRILLLIYISNICMGCQQNDSHFFNGDIITIENSIKETQEITLKKIFLNGSNFGEIAVYDSLMFFFNPKLNDRFFNIFNINTGEEIGTFCNKGGGPEEVTCLSPIFQFFREGNELKTLLFAPNERKLFIWNITCSIQQGRTIIDKIVPYNWGKENGEDNYNNLYILDYNILLAKVDPFPLNNGKSTLPSYQKRTFDTDSLLKNYSIYKQSIENEESLIMPEAFFNSNDALKPDGTKIVQAMIHLPQLNIINIETGQVVGYRMEKGDSFSIFQRNKNIKTHYIRVQADNNYIYAVYWGKEAWGFHEIPCVDTIHVFDWEGKLVQKIKTDDGIDKMFLDTCRNRLYMTRPNFDDVFYLNLSEIISTNNKAGRT